MVGAPPRHESCYACRTEYVEWLQRTLNRAHGFARTQLGVAARHQKCYYDRGVQPTKFSPETYAWYWYPPSANRKLGKGWSGPYRILSCPTETHCVIQEQPASRPRRVHINKLKPHLGRKPTQWAGHLGNDQRSKDPSDQGDKDEGSVDGSLQDDDGLEDPFLDDARSEGSEYYDARSEDDSDQSDEEGPQVGHSDVPSPAMESNLRRSKRERKPPLCLVQYCD